MKKWSLDSLYSSFESDEFQNDLLNVDQLVVEYNDLITMIGNLDNEELLVKYLKLEEKINDNFAKLYSFCSLKSSTDTKDLEAKKYNQLLYSKSSSMAKSSTIMEKWIATIDLEKLVKNNGFLNQYQYLLNRIKDNNRYVLSEEVEEVIVKLNENGSKGWSNLQSYLTSNLEVKYDDKIITLSEVRNLANSDDAKTRKKAYFAELDAYKKAEDSVAFALNHIKGTVNTLCDLRGYDSVLEKTLIQSRMDKKTLDALLSSMVDYLPKFHAYLKRKGEMLGHKNGLAWYDLYAPLGNSKRTFSIEDAEKYVANTFLGFSQSLNDLANNAFSNSWIDYTPRRGKVGGAFCANLPFIKESRILTNFTGSFSDVLTLAHELGHAYHGYVIEQNASLNRNYTMPVAETASIFCETIVLNKAIEDAIDDEKLMLIENELQNATAIICDIYSRYLFEKEVFELRKTSFISADQLKEIMLKAQKTAYGDGLNHDFLHPYMWLNKSHYYSGGLSFYNFPYAFGLLFAKGLYAQYEKAYKNNDDSFIAKYDEILKATGMNSVENVAKVANIDITDKQFWNDSLELINKQINLFLELTK